MSDKKDNVIQFPTKANVPDTLTISFGDSKPVTYTLSSDNIDLSGIDTVTVDISDNYDWENTMYTTGDSITINVTDPVEMLEAEMVRQMELDLKDE
jgi:hypothetical protein